jgi:hypothetical protein
MLPMAEKEFLDERAPAHSVVPDAGMVCIIVPDFPLGAGFDRATSDLLLRLSPGYPDVPPDMWWFDPPVRRADGAIIPATEVRERYFDREWQRWSRHFQPGQWRSGVDNLRSYLALISADLQNASAARAA